MNTQRHVHASIIASPVSVQFLVTLCVLEPNTRALQGQAMEQDDAPAVAAMPAPIDYADPGCARVAPQDPNLSASASAALVCGDPRLSSSGAAKPLSEISILLATDHLQQQHCLSLDPSCGINQDYRMVLSCQCKCSEGHYPDDDELLGMTIGCACTTCGLTNSCRIEIEVSEYEARGGLCDNCDASKRLMEAQAKVKAFKQKEAAQSQAKD
jgi:hypothetical protein